MCVLCSLPGFQLGRNFSGKLFSCFFFLGWAARVLFHHVVSPLDEKETFFFFHISVVHMRPRGTWSEERGGWHTGAAKSGE